MIQFKPLTSVVAAAARVIVTRATVGVIVSVIVGVVLVGVARYALVSHHRVESSPPIGRVRHWITNSNCPLYFLQELD